MHSTWLRSLLFATTLSFRALAAEPVEMKLGADLSRPVVMRVTIPAPPETARVQMVLTSPVARKARVVAFAPGSTWVNVEVSGGRSSEVRASAPLPFRVESRPNTEVVVVAFSEDETKPSSEDIFTRPDTDAKPSKRKLEASSIIPMLDWAGRVRTVTHASAQLARDLFTTIDRSFVLYATDTKASRCGLLVGEPVLVLDRRVLQPNGRFTECASNVDDFLSTTPPATLTLPAPEPPLLHTSNDWADEEFTDRAATDPRIAKYVAAKAIARQCDIKTWEKVDPSGRANHYDVVSYDEKGKVKSVEGYEDKLARQVARECREDALFKERDSIRASLAKHFVADETKRLEEIKRRLEAP